jgi:hypothetical protein
MRVESSVKVEGRRRGRGGERWASRLGTRRWAKGRAGRTADMRPRLVLCARRPWRETIKRQRQQGRTTRPGPARDTRGLRSPFIVLCMLVVLRLSCARRQGGEHNTHRRDERMHPLETRASMRRARRGGRRKRENTHGDVSLARAQTSHNATRHVLRTRLACPLACFVSAVPSVNVGVTAGAGAGRPQRTLRRLVIR